MSIELSFSFARKNQVVLAIAENSGISLFYTDRTPVSALLEMQRRLLEETISFHKLSK